MHPLIPKLGSDIRDIAGNYTLQEGQELIKLLVAKILVPSTNMDAIIWLCHEVLLDIIDDNCLLQLSSQLRQVFHVDSMAEFGVVPVKSRGDVPSPVKVVEDPVRVILEPCCKHH